MWNTFLNNWKGKIYDEINSMAKFHEFSNIGIQVCGVIFISSFESNQYESFSINFKSLCILPMALQRTVVVSFMIWVRYDDKNGILENRMLLSFLHCELVKSSNKKSCLRSQSGASINWDCHTTLKYTLDKVN